MLGLYKISILEFTTQIFILKNMSVLEFQIIGYPSIKVFKRGNEEVDYWGDNNDEDISDFIESNLLRNTSEL